MLIVLTKFPLLADWPWLFATTIANSWRISGDIFDTCESLHKHALFRLTDLEPTLSHDTTVDRNDARCPCTDITSCNLAGFHCSMRKITQFAKGLGQKVMPGSWADLDMLEVGSESFAYRSTISNIDACVSLLRTFRRWHDDHRIVSTSGRHPRSFLVLTASSFYSVTHFSMWAMMRSPMILGNDLSNMDNATRAIIKNKHVLNYVSGDPSGSAAYPVWEKEGDDAQLWLSQLTNGSYAVALVNWQNTTRTETLDFADMFLDDKTARNATWDAYDLWQGVDYDKGTVPDELKAYNGSPFKGSMGKVSVEAHGIRLFRLVPAGTSGMGVSEARRLKSLEDENSKLKRMLADAMLDNAALKDLLGKS